MSKVEFYITDQKIVPGTNDILHKSDAEQAAKMKRRIARMIRRRPDILERHPDWEEHKDADIEMQERAQETKERKREERPGVVHEELKQDDGSEEKSYGESQKIYREDYKKTHAAAPEIEIENGEVKVNKGADGHVSSVAVLHGDHILMGKRRDNGRWTLPGGHLEKDEDPHDGGRRELEEEAGIEAEKLDHLASEKIKTHTGKEKTIHAYKYEVTERPKTSMKNDPDAEVERWKWIKHKGGLPKHVKENLHSPKNLVLDSLAIKSAVLTIPRKGGGSIANYREQAKEEGKDFAHGGIATKQQYQTKERIEDEEISEKSLFYVRDLLKSRPHKYIRKYRGRNGEWVYIYHEGDQHHVLSEEDVAAHRHLAEHGDEDERQHHRELIENMQEMGDDDIAAHKLLAEHGDEHERRHHNAILEAIGHRKSELERQIARAQATDDADRPLSSDHAGKVKAALIREIDGVFSYLQQHASTPIAQALNRLDKPELIKLAGRPKTIREAIKVAHEIAKKFEAAQGSATSSNGSVTAAGGTYGNMIYQKALDRMVSDGVMSREYAEEHKRTARSANLEVQDMKGIQERAERARREREERERRELGEIRDGMAFHMNSLMDGQRLSIDEVKRLHRTLKEIFGRDMKPEDFPYNFPDQGITPKIKRISISGNRVSMNVQLYRNGQPMMSNFERSWYIDNGRPHIHNDYMAVRPEVRDGVQVGNLINQNQRRLMRSTPRGGVVSVFADIDVGGYTWANQGFEISASELRSLKQNFQYFLREHGMEISAADLEHFKYPVHFAQFDVGKKWVIRTSRGVEMPLTEAQKSSRSLSGKPGEHELTAEEIRSGKTTRMAVTIGKKFLLNRNWHGEWDSAVTNEATKFADQYYQLRDRAVEHLSPQYRAVGSRVGAGQSRAEAPVRTPRSPESSARSTRVQNHINYWQNRRTGRLTMSERRCKRVAQWPPEERDEFLRVANITPSAKRRIRSLIAGGASGG